MENITPLIRVAVIGYRDICDKDLRFSIQNFIDVKSQDDKQQIAKILSFIDGLKAVGGGDDAKDINGAI